MPLYDYRCIECDTVFSGMKTITERKTSVCPNCNGDAKQLISAPTIALDGTDPGFPTAYAAWAKRHERAGK